MAKIIAMILIAVGMLMTGCHKEVATTQAQGTEKVDQTGATSKPAALSSENEAVLRRWLGAEKDTDGTEKVARICLRAKLTRSQIIELIGKPRGFVDVDSEFLSYGFIPSQTLDFYFDKDGIITKAELMGRRINLSDK
ncbi:MAG: hypothetical protein K8S55_10605 [Phycisphaerae bacterium]|nr:hypothetical protein [Phycisphaerae bacterium]